MKALFNKGIVEYNKIQIGLEDRGFQYGDGFFETLVARNGVITNLKYHLERTSEGMDALYFDRPEYLTDHFLTQQTQQLLLLNDHEESARIKWIFWRKPGGLYTPIANKINSQIITFFHPTDFIIPIGKISFCETSMVNFSRFSTFKTLNSLNYVLAGIEKKQKNVNDLILMDPEGHIAECIASNIFWIKGKNYFTPSIRSGCINGVMRRHIIKKLQEAGRSISEGLYSTDEILQSDSIFLSNAAGVYPVKYLDEKLLLPPEDLEKFDPLN